MAVAERQGHQGLDYINGLIAADDVDDRRRLSSATRLYTLSTGFLSLLSLSIALSLSLSSFHVQPLLSTSRASHWLHWSCLSSLLSVLLLHAVFLPALLAQSPAPPLSCSAVSNITQPYKQTVPRGASEWTQLDSRRLDVKTSTVHSWFLVLSSSKSESRVGNGNRSNSSNSSRQSCIPLLSLSLSL